MCCERLSAEVSVIKEASAAVVAAAAALYDTVRCKEVLKVTPSPFILAFSKEL